MKKVNLGTILVKRRKEKGITQEELAEYLGVSKPAVSKWESGQSYPDILLLPVIAAYFNMSVDELLGYEAQMTREDIKKLYLKLADEFANEPFEKVYSECMEKVKTYYSCWNLLFAMAQLLVNHASLSGSPDRMNAIFKQSADIFQRVEQESGDTVLARQALSMRAYCFLILQQPAETIDLMDGIEETQISTEILLAKAYSMKGDSLKAKSLIQSCLYKNLVALFGSFADMMPLYSDEPDKIDDCLKKALDLGDVFNLKDMHPALYFTLFLTAASLFATKKRNDRALDVLEMYADLVSKKDVFPIKLKGNDFFDLLESFFNSLNLGTSAPRSDILIRKDIINTVTNNPVFQNLASEERFRLIVRRLEHLEEETHE